MNNSTAQKRRNQEVRSTKGWMKICNKAADLWLLSHGHYHGGKGNTIPRTRGKS